MFARAVAVVLIAIGLLLAVRRLLIGQTDPLPVSTTLATAVVLLLLLFAVRRAAAGQLFSWLPTIVLATWAIACSYPGSQPTAWFIWLGVIALDLALTRHRTASMHLIQAMTDTNETGVPEHSTIIADTDLSKQPGEGQVAGQSDGEIVLQHVVRVRDANGNEHVHATLRGELAAGERRTTLYVGFCPPLTGVPQVEAEVIEGPPGMAKVIQSLHNGVQVEVDLDEASLEDSNVTVEVAAYQAEAT